jgi:hypothetical protein
VDIETDTIPSIIPSKLSKDYRAASLEDETEISDQEQRCSIGSFVGQLRVGYRPVGW